MTTIYLILSWTGWIWTAFFGTYLFMKLRRGKENP
jgi:TM2 domain-containing membrane protein YozV